MKPVHDDALIAAVQERDEAAFRNLYRRHSPSVYAFALRLAAGDETLATDLMQDAWIRAVESLTRFRRESAFRTWLIAILVNCYREQLRDAKRHVHLALHETEVPARATSLSMEDGVALEMAVRKLPDGFREVFLLHDVEGYRHTEIADILGIHPGTSKSQLSRARQALRAALEAPNDKTGDAG